MGTYRDGTCYRAWVIWKSGIWKRTSYLCSVLRELIHTWKVAHLNQHSVHLKRHPVDSAALFSFRVRTKRSQTTATTWTSYRASNNWSFLLIEENPGDFKNRSEMHQEFVKRKGNKYLMKYTRDDFINFCSSKTCDQWAVLDGHCFICIFIINHASRPKGLDMSFWIAGRRGLRAQYKI